MIKYTHVDEAPVDFRSFLLWALHCSPRSISDLARATGIGKTTLWRFYHSKSNLTLDRAAALAFELGINFTLDPDRVRGSFSSPAPPDAEIISVTATPCPDPQIANGDPSEYTYDNAQPGESTPSAGET